MVFIMILNILYSKSSSCFPALANSFHLQFPSHFQDHFADVGKMVLTMPYSPERRYLWYIRLQSESEASLQISVCMTYFVQKATHRREATPHGVLYNRNRLQANEVSAAGGKTVLF